MKSTSSPRENTQPLDVLVVGGGNAALCAAITARRAGASVMLLEASPKEFRGGNSRHTRNIRYVHAAKNDFLAFMPLRGMCHQYLLACRNEQPGSLPPSETVKNHRTDCQPAGRKRSLL